MKVSRPGPYFCLLECVLQSELNQARIHGRAVDLPEVGGIRSHHRDVELWMVERIKKFGAERKHSVFFQTADSRRLDQGQIPVELAWPENESDAGIAVAKRGRRRSSSKHWFPPTQNADLLK